MHINWVIYFSFPNMVSDITEHEQIKVFSIKGRAVMLTSKFAVETFTSSQGTVKGQLAERKRAAEAEV